MFTEPASNDSAEEVAEEVQAVSYRQVQLSIRAPVKGVGQDVFQGAQDGYVVA